MLRPTMDQVPVVAPDGQTVAYLAVDGSCRAWRLGPGDTIELRESRDRELPFFTALTFTPDGRRVAVGDLEWRFTRIFDVDTGKLVDVPSDHTTFLRALPNATIVRGSARAIALEPWIETLSPSAARDFVMHATDETANIAGAPI